MSFHSALVGANLHIGRANSGAGTPIGVVTPTIVGEFYYDTLGGSLFVANGLTNVDWVAQSGTTFPFGAIDGPNGFPVDPATGEVDRASSTLSFNDGTRELTISPTGAEFTFYQGGGLFTSTGDTIAISPDEGMHYVYYDLGTLTETTTWDPDLYYSKVMVASVYWSSLDITSVSVCDERHGCKMDGQTRSAIHGIASMNYVSGLDPTDIVIGDGSLNAHAQFGVDIGSTRDEDLFSSLASVVSTTGLPIIYRTGLGEGNWRKFNPWGYSVYQEMPANPLTWNQNTGVTWTFWPVTEAWYVLCHVFATNDINTPLVAFMGMNEYETIDDVDAVGEISILKNASLPFIDAVPLVTIVFQSAVAFTNTPKCRVVQNADGDDYYDWRGQQIVAPGVTDHAALDNLGFDLAGHTGYQRETYQGALAPTVDNDSADSAGIGVTFRQGDLWVAGDTNELFYAADVGVGAADWRKLPGEEEIPYDNLVLAWFSNTAITIPPPVSRNSLGPAVYAQYSNSYRYCFWDITQIDGVVINQWRRLRFASWASLYSFLQANAAQSGGFYSGHIVGRVYDIVGPNIPSVHKIYGVNKYYSVLRGRHKYLDTRTQTMAQGAMTWTSRVLWIESLKNQQLSFIGGPHNPNSFGAVWFSRTMTRQLYRQPVTGFTLGSLGGLGRYVWDWGSSDWSPCPVDATWNNTQNPFSGFYHLWSPMNTMSLTWSWDDQPKYAARSVYNYDQSVICVHRIETNHMGDSMTAVYIKPVGIDTAVLNYIDTSQYYIYAYYDRRFHTPRVKKLVVPNLGVQWGRARDCTQIDKHIWFPFGVEASVHGSHASLSPTGLADPPNVHFIVKDRATGFVSRPSLPYLQMKRGLCNAPYSWEVVH